MTDRIIVINAKFYYLGKKLDRIPMLSALESDDAIQRQNRFSAIEVCLYIRNGFFIAAARSFQIRFVLQNSILSRQIQTFFWYRTVEECPCIYGIL